MPSRRRSGPGSPLLARGRGSWRDCWQRGPPEATETAATCHRQLRIATGSGRAEAVASPLYILIYTHILIYNEAFSISFRFSVLVAGRRHSMKFNKIKTISKRKQKARNETKKKKKNYRKWVRQGARHPRQADDDVAEWSLALACTGKIKIRDGMISQLSLCLYCSLFI